LFELHTRPFEHCSVEEHTPGTLLKGKGEMEDWDRCAALLESTGEIKDESAQVPSIVLQTLVPEQGVNDEHFSQMPVNLLQMYPLQSTS
jgi:hypothetical protein